MKIKLKDKKIDNSFSYRGLSKEDWKSLNNGKVIEVDSVSKYAKDFVVEVSPKKVSKAKEGDK